MKEKLKDFIYNNDMDAIAFILSWTVTMIMLAICGVTMKLSDPVEEHPRMVIAMFVMLGICMFCTAVTLLIFAFELFDRMRVHAINKKLNYLKCSKSVLLPGHVLVNQKCSPKAQDGCSLAKFADDLRTLERMMPDGTVYHCITHENLRKIIAKQKTFEVQKVVPTYKKDLEALQKKIRSEKCQGCKNDRCPLSKVKYNSTENKKETQFYRMKFVKKTKE